MTSSHQTSSHQISKHRTSAPAQLLRLAFVGAIALSALTLSGCGPTHKMTTPDGFSRFDKGKGLKMITASGVRMKSREVDNYPKASLQFWTDATVRHLKARGYALRAKKCFKTNAELSGCTVDFVIPRGQEDWVLGVTLFVVDKKLVLVEAAGPFKRYAPVEKELHTALLSFRP